MPLYTFKCKKCGVEFDERQSLEEFDAGKLPDRKSCDNGESKCEVERVISPLKATSSSWSNWRR